MQTSEWKSSSTLNAAHPIDTTVCLPGRNCQSIENAWWHTRRPQPLDHAYTSENLELLKAGCANMVHHIENAAKFGVRCVVAINKMSADTDAELALVKSIALAANAHDAVISTHWADGGVGAVDLAQAVVKACGEARIDASSPFRFLYP